MASWAALNVAGNDTRDASARERATEEAQDADNAAMYEQALRFQQRQQMEKAKEIYLELLNGDVVVNSRLEYLCNKNLATMEFENRAYEAALGYFAEALALDATDVVVWYQMATTAIETGKLWLARHTLEEGMKVDATYWPLVGTLAEVLFEIGDQDEYERVGAYLRGHDSQNASMRLMDKESVRRRVTTIKENCGTALAASGGFSKKRSRPSVRDIKLLGRAQQRLTHLREITEHTTKRRRMLQDDLNQKLELALRPREYYLQQESWQELGKLLLEAFEDANSDVNTDTTRATVGIRITFRDEVDSISKTGDMTKDTSAGVSNAATESSSGYQDAKELDLKAGSLAQKDEVAHPSAKRHRQEDATPVASNASEHSATATGASDNDTQDSGAPISEVEEFQPRRRKSRRHEQRLRQEHAAAVKKAREKDLAYRLRAFLPNSSGKDGEGSSSESEVDKTSTSVDWPSPLDVKLVGTKFRVSNEKNETLAQIESFSCPSSSSRPSDPVGVSTARSTALNPTAEDIHPPEPVRSVTREQIAAFVTENGLDTTQSPGLLDLIREYLNQCGRWANLKLGGDDEEPHGVCFWLEKMLNGDLDVSKTSVRTQRSAISFANRSTMQGTLAGGGNLTLSAQLFLLELHFDMLLRQPTRRRRRVMKRGLESLLTRAHSLLLELCLVEDSEEEPKHCRPSEIEFTRLFWLLARMHERCGNPQVAQSYYGKCREKLIASAEEIDQDTSTGGPRVCLPNQKADTEISLDILEEKISGLRFSDVCSEAKRLLECGDHAQVVSVLLGHFFPTNQPPRIVDLLSEFDPEEDQQPSHSVGGKNLFEIVLDSLGQCSKFSADDAILLLLTALYHSLAVLDSLDQKEGQGASDNYPEEAFGNAFAAVEFLLRQLSTMHRENIADTRHHLLMRALCVWCFKPAILLLFEAPGDLLATLGTVLDAASISASKYDKEMESGRHAQRTLTVDTAGRLFFTIRRFSNADFRDLFALAPYPSKKKQPRQDRVRSFVADLLRILNRNLRHDEKLTRFVARSKRSALMALCCKMMKEEEDIVTRSEGKPAKQLLGNGAILFMLLFESFQTQDLDSVPVGLVDLIHLLHGRLGQHGICGLTYLSQGGAQGDKQGGSCFLETCARLLDKYVKLDGDKTHRADSERATIKKTGAPNDDDDGTGEEDGDEEEEEEEEEAENRFKKEICQGFRCLYDVQIVSGLEDHKTGNAFDLLQKESQATRHSDAIRLARFAVPILLEREPKNNHQKKERLKLLYAVRDALSDSSLAALPEQPSSASSKLKEYLAPRDLLQWRDAPPLPPSGSSRKGATANESCLGNLWYLLGANFILGRVKRRGNLGELKEMEHQVKERTAFLTKDVLYYHPERIDSWIRLGKSMKELYHAASDACAVVLGQKLRIRALGEYSKQVCAQEEKSPVKPDTDVAGQLTTDEFSFEHVVLNGELFAKMKAWQDDDSAVQSAGSRPSTGASGAGIEAKEQKVDNPQQPQAQLPIEEYATRYVGQVIEFSRRCFAMAARLGEEAILKREQSLKLKKQNSSEDGGEDDGEFDEELDELRITVIECYEECGLLLYNVLQEFSVMKEENLAQFPEQAYLCVVKKALAYFHQGMALCEADEEAHEVRFRLCYMIGKTLKKRRWCEMTLQKVPNKQSLATAAEMAGCFAKAEAAKEDGEMEHALVHAFYALQALRMDLTTSEPPTISGLRLACEHFFEEEDEEDDNESEEEQVDTNSNAEDQGSQGSKKTGESRSGSRGESVAKSKKPTSAATNETGSSADDDNKSTPWSRKDEILALLAKAKDSNPKSQIDLVAARGWLALNVIEALESIPNEDRYFHPSRYVLARGVYWLSNFYHLLVLREDKDDSRLSALVDALEARRSLLNVEGPSDAAARAMKEMTPIFDKKRSQVVAIWFSEYIPTAKKFEELNQRQMKYDHYRLKYWRFYIRILQENEAYGRLREVGSWVLACKEEHDVIDIMLGIVLEARGRVLRVRLRRLLDTVESADPEVTSAAMGVESQSPLARGEGLVETILKHLAKAYTYYLEVVDAHHRLVHVRVDSNLLLENAELPMVALLFAGATTFPSQMPLLEKDVDLVDRDFDQNVTVIKNALRRDELPPRIYDAEGREAWKAFLEATRSFCEDRWPERMGKGKLTKSRLRLKASTTTGATTDATQTALEQPS